MEVQEAASAGSIQALIEKFERRLRTTALFGVAGVRLLENGNHEKLPTITCICRRPINFNEHGFFFCNYCGTRYAVAILESVDPPDPESDEL